jgi:hypothetical protein
MPTPARKTVSKIKKKKKLVLMHSCSTLLQQMQPFAVHEHLESKFIETITLIVKTDC